MRASEQEYRDTIAAVLGVVVFAIAALALLAIGSAANAQALDGYKPKAIPTPPIAGLYVDQTARERYCVAESGRLGPFGTQTFLHCAAGWNNAGHTILEGAPALGREYLLYRLAGEFQMFPAVVNSVTIVDSAPGLISVRFGSPGAQSPAYTLILQ